MSNSNGPSSQGMRRIHSIRNVIKRQFKETWPIAVIGLILLCLGIGVLFWNEGKAVKIAHSLDEALNNIVVIKKNFKNLPDLEGQLIYVSGPLSISEPLTEPDYGVMISCIKLKRRVQMFQWVEMEEEKDFPGMLDTERYYYYSQEWKDKLIDSSTFYIQSGHENPKEIPIKSQIQVADEARIGNIIFGNQLKQKFSDFIEVTSDERPERKDIKMHSGLYYHSSDLFNPAIGDLRIQLSYAGKAGDIYTVVGKLKKGSLEPYVTTHGQEVLLQRQNEVPVDLIFHLEHRDNYWRTWVIRGFGWLILFLSATCLAKMLRTIVMNSNTLRELIAIESLALTSSIFISLMIIGFAWVLYRPIIGLCLAMASILPFLYTTIGGVSSRTVQRNEYQRL